MTTSVSFTDTKFKCRVVVAESFTTYMLTDYARSHKILQQCMRLCILFFSGFDHSDDAVISQQKMVSVKLWPERWWATCIVLKNARQLFCILFSFICAFTMDFSDRRCFCKLHSCTLDCACDCRGYRVPLKWWKPTEVMFSHLLYCPGIEILVPQMFLHNWIHLDVFLSKCKSMCSLYIPPPLPPLF